MSLTTLKLQNIRNITELELNFSNGQNVLAKPNRYGKTTIADAVCFLLVGKLYNGSSDLPSLKPIHNMKAVVTVEATFTDGASSHTIKKEYSEKWVTPRGSTVAELAGHDTVCSIDGVKQSKASDYDKWLCGFFNVPDLETLHAVINPRFFSDKLTWQKRRAIVLSVIGDVRPSDVFKVEPFTIALADAIEKNGNNIAAVKKTYKADLDKFVPFAQSLQNQIDGAPIPTITEEQFLTAAKTVSSNLNRVTELKARKIGAKDAELTPLRVRQGELNEALYKSVKLDNDAISKANETLNDEIATARQHIGDIRKTQNDNIRKIMTAKNDLERANTLLTKKQGEVADLREDFKQTASATYPHLESSKCPQCGFQLNAAEDAEREKNWQADREKRKNEIKARGVALNAEIETIKAEIAKNQENIKTLEDVNKDHDKTILELDNLILDKKSKIKYDAAEDSVNTQNIRAELARVKAEIEEVVNRKEDTGSIDAEIQTIEAETVKAQEIITKREAERITTKQKTEREKALADTRKSIAECEQKSMLCDIYRKAYMNLVAVKAKESFPDIALRLLQENISGTIEEVCFVETDNGAPYANANTEWQIKAGVRIIRILEQKLGYKSPVVLIDNAEAITADNRVYDYDGQIVSLVAQGVEFRNTVDEEARAS